MRAPALPSREIRLSISFTRSLFSSLRRLARSLPLRSSAVRAREAMSSRFATSKYRHAVGSLEKKENWYPDLQPAASAPSDAELLAVNSSLLAVSWTVNGAIGVLPLSDVGKRSGREVPLIHAPSGTIYELAFNPFNDTQLLSSGDDAAVRLWQLEDGVGLSQNLGTAAATLSGHTKRVSTIRWNPTASGVVVSGSHDGSVKVRHRSAIDAPPTQCCCCCCCCDAPTGGASHSRSCVNSPSSPPP